MISWVKDWRYVYINFKSSNIYWIVDSF
jgi:hypothetical protein